MIRQLTEHKELLAAQRLYESIWRSTTPPVSAELMRALIKSGNYVAGAFDGEDLVGACAAFCSPPAESLLHSHIAGVVAGGRGRGVGHALKLDQRQWALERGIREITWTFDPLVRRNAYFNLAKLGVDATEYLADFYGHMQDDINVSGESDRLFVRWNVAAAQPRVVSATGVVGLGIAADGMPVRGTTAGSTVLVAVPPDIETLRTVDPAAANEWRHAVRDVLGGLLAEGARITGFDRAGWYAVERNES